MDTKVKITQLEVPLIYEAASGDIYEFIPGSFCFDNDVPKQDQLAPVPYKLQQLFDSCLQLFTPEEQEILASLQNNRIIKIKHPRAYEQRSDQTSPEGLRLHHRFQGYFERPEESEMWLELSRLVPGEDPGALFPDRVALYAVQSHTDTAPRFHLQIDLNGVKSSNYSELCFVTDKDGNGMLYLEGYDLMKTLDDMDALFPDLGIGSKISGHLSEMKYPHKSGPQLGAPEVKCIDINRIDGLKDIMWKLRRYILDGNKE